MNAHRCRTCVGWESSVLETEGEIVHMLRVAQKRPGTPQAINSVARIPMLKERLRKTRRFLAEHRVEVTS